MATADGRAATAARDRRTHDDGPTPQRWLEEGEELRRCVGVDVVARWRVPPTLRMDRQA